LNDAYPAAGVRRIGFAAVAAVSVPAGAANAAPDSFLFASACKHTARTASDGLMIGGYSCIIRL
jgi:hypothetical protein